MTQLVLALYINLYYVIIWLLVWRLIGCHCPYRQTMYKLLPSVHIPHRHHISIVNLK